MPPKNKGLSANQKRDRIMKIFTERKEVFSYPQLEKEADKVGIRRDNLKEILESLLSDNLVETENLGTSKCYWSLPSQALIRLQQKCAEYTEKIDQERQKEIEIEAQFESMKEGRENCQQRTDLENEINQYRQQYQVLLKNFELKQKNDPERLQKLKKDTVNLRYDANSWTDDIIQLSFYLKSQAGMSSEQLDQLGIPADIDNI
ncbi:unnamed protein product (macronuclear) [Paramecium tetraurelia]|uniref:Mnd1 HTH domain-containing protein n=1 Tax=Paramecium tetraurelia TaxID=5888 RepID=A0CHV9_PARTE|nr:uncharacterized protein GSPATT00038478001 [Paramecium tetraurelia]CAK70376.1 unnamed protein product [Paramecium tetraurelia]|eukprot:XP_001437773.1 hypothetical protein (macronuclear) [Paramecium tetraurelia strain d4-2]